MFRRAAFVITATLVSATPASSQLSAPHSAALQQAASASSRTPANVARDRYRNPVQTLSFFGVKPTDTVVEIFPGRGWYSEILIPYVTAGGGTYYAAAPERGLVGFRAFQQTKPELYGRAKTAVFPVRAATHAGVPDGTADVVLTFRNVHNWMMGEEPYAELAFKQIFAMLKPGGTLGVVDHRLPEAADSAREKTSGYLKTSTVRRLAEQAGFQLVGSSEINANPKDTTDHPEGVWTLPPTLELGDKDREKYLAIGESDRMTLKFVKPAGVPSAGN
ncbi:class I SAM-dependent methyltransferase [Sphingomonas arenae]|uniref:class I SAM-dependent methyltransferase n=1 Tax=Sphingomonas arenae TaxID=2812555 RepID=UPI001966F14C|nr:class I SAM-dependent methyltransferase [Sphingomonas arenae]